MAPTVCKFSKIFRGSMPPDTPKIFFILSILQNHSAKKKTTLENMSKFGVLSLKKFLEYATDVKTFFKGLFTPFLGLTSLRLVNIPPNSKFRPPPTKTCGSAPECKIEDFLDPPFKICWVRPWGSGLPKPSALDPRL